MTELAKGVLAGVCKGCPVVHSEWEPSSLRSPGRDGKERTGVTAPGSWGWAAGEEDPFPFLRNLFCKGWKEDLRSAS